LCQEKAGNPGLEHVLLQGDQIGRIFAYWVIDCFGQFFENYRSSPKFLATIFHGKNKVSILIKTGWASLWAIFYKLIWSPCSVVAFVWHFSKHAEPFSVRFELHSGRFMTSAFQMKPA
jgi:hypothetical protein